VTTKRGVFALGDLDHQQNRGAFGELTRMANLPTSKSEFAHAWTLKF